MASKGLDWVRTHKLATAIFVLLATLLVVFLALSAEDASKRPVADLSTVAPTTGPTVLRDIVVVGINWDGSADVFDPATFEVVKRFDVVPDFDERLVQVNSSRVRRLFFRLIRNVIGEGNNQLVDDMFTSHDGKYLYVSRPSFADVVALDLGRCRPMPRSFSGTHSSTRSFRWAPNPTGRPRARAASTATSRSAGRSGGDHLLGRRARSGERPRRSSPTASADGEDAASAVLGRVRRGC